ncbi:DsbA family protein [Candidatus Woesearchaeota archaeon]|nr:DsbA family protein [Candidatus Woesearchaeota archaeon]
MSETEKKEQKEEQKGKEDKPLFTVKKSDVWKITTVVLAVLLVWSLFFRGPAGAIPTPTGAVVAQQPTAAPAARVQVSADDDPVKGDKDAPVTIIEFSDYQCPFCGRFYTQTLPELEKEYISTGKVKLVYRDFPLTSIHQEAKPAAIAANCARKQGGDEMYYKYHDKLFIGGGQALSAGTYKTYATELGLNMNKFEQCLADPSVAQEVDSDTQDGMRSGVQGTPAFFVNGQLLSGAQPFPAFKQMIDAELAK